MNEMDTVEALILDLLEWVALRERSYEDTMAAWRTSCPRLPVWEDANDRGFIVTENSKAGSTVRVTPTGAAFLKQHRGRDSSTVNPAIAGGAC